MQEGQQEAAREEIVAIPVPLALEQLGHAVVRATMTMRALHEVAAMPPTPEFGEADLGLAIVNTRNEQIQLDPSRFGFTRDQLVDMAKEQLRASLLDTISHISTLTASLVSFAQDHAAADNNREILKDLMGVHHGQQEQQHGQRGGPADGTP